MQHVFVDQDMGKVPNMDTDEMLCVQSQKVH